MDASPVLKNPSHFSVLTPFDWKINDFIQFVCFIFNFFNCDTMDSANLLLKRNQSRSKTGISISNPAANQAIKSGSNTLNNGHSFPPLNPLDFQA